ALAGDAQQPRPRTDADPRRGGHARGPQRRLTPLSGKFYLHPIACAGIARPARLPRCARNDSTVSLRGPERRSNLAAASPAQRGQSVVWSALFTTDFFYRTATRTFENWRPLGSYSGSNPR